MKKIILGASFLATASGTMAMSVSCGNDSKKVDPNKKPNPGNGDVVVSEEEQERIDNVALGANPTNGSRRFDTNNQSEVIIGSTFSQGSYQERAINTVLDQYNKLLKEKSKDVDWENGLPTKQKNLGSGYSAGATKVQSDLSSTSKDEFYNIILNYPTVASILADYNMLLSFNDEISGLNTDITTFNEGFISSNSNTENISNSSTYVLPTLKSSNVLAINGPVLSYIIDSMVSAGASKATDAESQAFFAKVTEAGKTDRASVANLWGAPRSSVRANNIEISADTFKVYTKLMEFAEKAQELFTNSYNDGKPVESELHIFGIDGSPALFNTAVYAALNGNDANMITHIAKKNGQSVVDFGTLTRSDSEGYLAARKVYNNIAQAVKVGALKLLPGGQFASGDQQKHKYAMSIGSSAGYTHNFVELENGTTTTYEIKNVVSIEDNISDNYKNFLSIEKDKADEKVAKNIKSAKVEADDVLTSFGKHKNLLLKSNKTPTGYNVAAVDQQSEASLTNALANVSSENTLLIKINDYNATSMSKIVEKAKEQNIYGGIVKDKNDNKSLFLIIPNGLTTENGKTKVSDAGSDKLVQLGFKKETLNSTQLLNKNELISLATPGKWESKDKYSVVYGQGPSIMGIHSNDKGDAATKAFVKWLFSDHKYIFDKRDKNKTELTPIQYLNKVGSYITPLKGFENNDVAKLYGDNDYLKVTFDMFKKVGSDSSYKLYEEPSSTKSDTFRSAIESAFNNLQSTGTQTFDKFVEILLGSIK